MEVAAYREPSVLGRKRPFGTRKAKKTEVAIFGAVDDTERAREAVRQRYRSELVAARGLLEKAVAALSSPASSPISAPRVVKHSRRRGFLAAESRSEEPPAKKIKAAPSPPLIKRKKMTRGERDLLAAGLAKLASELPDHIIELLKRHSRGISDGEMEIDINAVEDEALLEIQQQLDEFVRERADPSRRDHQADGRMMAEEEEEYVDIVRGVSPLAIAPAPLQLAEDDEEYVDICGDASPVVTPKNLADDATVSGSQSSSTSSGSESRAERDATLLMASAKEYLERCRAREKARQEVLQTERTAMPNETIHPTVFKSLHIVEYNMARPDNLLRQLGLFLKVEVDDYGIGIGEQQQHHHCQSFQEDLEEGEIRF
uniref:Uncharacterized protein n=1 Tax=Avena sativa TaxID=4498 RepID=A0ACD5YIS3_AVESA